MNRLEKLTEREILGSIMGGYDPQESEDVQKIIKNVHNEFLYAIASKSPTYYEAAINVAKTAYHYARSSQDRLEAGAVGWRHICEYDLHHEREFKNWLKRKPELFTLFKKFAKSETNDLSTTD